MQRTQVLSTHLLVLRAISERFEAMCGALLPQYEFTLAPVATDEQVWEAAGAGAAAAAAEGAAASAGGGSAGGVMIRFRAAVQVAGREWSGSLEQLSGGQRTLVSKMPCVAGTLVVITLRLWCVYGY